MEAELPVRASPVIWEEVERTRARAGSGAVHPGIDDADPSREAGHGHAKQDTELQTRSWYSSSQSAMTRSSEWNGANSKGAAGGFSNLVGFAVLLCLGALVYRCLAMEVGAKGKQL